MGKRVTRTFQGVVLLSVAALLVQTYSHLALKDRNAWREKEKQELRVTLPGSSRTPHPTPTQTQTPAPRKKKSRAKCDTPIGSKSCKIDAEDAIIIESSDDVLQGNAVPGIIKVVGKVEGEDVFTERSPADLLQKVSDHIKKMTAATKKERYLSAAEKAAGTVYGTTFLAQPASHTVLCVTEGMHNAVHPHGSKVLVETKKGSYALQSASLCDVWDALQCEVTPSGLLHPLLAASCAQSGSSERELLARRASYPSCTTMELSLEKVIVLGGKTALYRGMYNGVAAGVKHFTKKWYENFFGFFLFALHSRVRHPYINYPLSACEYGGSILQPQKFLLGKDLKHWKASKGAKQLPWGTRLKWAVRIACIHQFLHEHPHGPFTYDDNHPGQYFITEDGPVMIDIDTIQKTDARNFSKCRCFGCNGGRANCQFVNSPEGYAYCGIGNTKQDTGVARDTCTVKTDIWFLGQVLQMLLPSGKAAMMENHGEKVGSKVCTEDLFLFPPRRA